MAKPRLPKVVEYLRVVLESNAAAFLILLFYSWLRSIWRPVSTYILSLVRPGHIWILLAISVLCALAIVAALVSAKIMRSLRLGLISLTHQLWVVSLTICWILFARHHYILAFLPVFAAEVLTLLLDQIHQPTLRETGNETSMDPDLALSENGIDLLNRSE